MGRAKRQPPTTVIAVGAPAPKPPAAKPPAVDPARVEQVVRWLISGNRDADVLEAIQATWPEQQLTALLAAAIDQLAASAEFDKEVVKGYCFEATKDVYRRMLEIGDLVGALRAIKQLWELSK